MRVGKWLLTEKKKVKIKEVSNMLGVSSRTLSNWKKQVEKSESKIGRPKYNKDQQFKALMQVGREWKRQGCSAGWRVVDAGLQNTIPTRLVQKTLSRLKLLKRKKVIKRIKSQRISIQVKYKNIYWSQDGAKYKNEKYQVIKDRASLKILAADRFKKETSKNIMIQLGKIKQSRGLPLVLSTDNGSMYTSKDTEEFLSNNKVIHLRSLPRTPEHNGSVEVAIREMKEVALLNGCSLSEAALKLNKNRLRTSFLFKSSDEIDDKLMYEYNDEMRSIFYESCKAEIEKSCSYLKNKRSKRMMERKVILEKLEQFGFITINRGDFN